MRKYLIILLFFAACSPAKRIERQQRQFDQIGRKWLEKNPCVNDSTIVYLKGDTVTTERIDTVYFGDAGIIDGDTTWINGEIKPIPCPVKTITRTITKAVHDTVKIVVKDIQQDRLCESDLKKAEQDLAASKLSEARGKKWVWISISLALLVLFLIYANLKKLF